MPKSNSPRRPLMHGHGAASLNADQDEDGSYHERSRLLRDPTSGQDTSGEDSSVQVEIVASAPTQSSIITIFSMWNTMMGTSLLSMPWALKQAGFVNGIILLNVMAAIMCYTSYRILVSGKSIVGHVVSDFTDIVRVYLGRVPGVIALLCSLVVLLGGAIVYWVLMSNFLYHIGIFIYHHTHGNNQNQSLSQGFSSVPDDVVCAIGNTSSESPLDPSFEKFWSKTHTVPFFLLLLLFPLLNFKSPTFFTKFNALGTVSVTYLCIFVAVKAGGWGMHLDLDTDHSSQTDYGSAFEWSFPALTGIAGLAYFLQNAILEITKTQKNPENNTRDLIIAYALVCLTYTYMGSVFFAAYPLPKSCIADIYLNNIVSKDIMAFVARIGLLFQMTCVFPLLLFVFRAQLLNFLFQTMWPSWKHVLALNTVIVIICVLFAVFYPNIGTIISFVGAFCSFSYAICIPCLVYMVACHKVGTLTIPKIIFHGVLIIIGLANFLAQFVIMGHTQW